MKEEIINDNLLKAYDSLILEMANINEDWKPTLKRFEYLLSESGVNPDEYYYNHKERIINRRKTEEIKK